MTDDRGSAAGAAESKLVDDARARRRGPPSRREWLAASVGSGSFLLAAALFAAIGPWGRPVDVVAAVLFAAAFAAVSRVEIEIASGSALPTQLVFVPMLFVLPLPLVPWCVSAGYVASGLLAARHDHTHPLRAWSLVGCSWFSLSPAVVLALAGSRPPGWQHWPVYLVALAAQCATDLAHSSFHEAVAHSIPPRRMLPALGRVYAFDALLSPVAFLAALAPGGGIAVLGLLPLVVVFMTLASERRERFDAEIQAAALESLAHRDPLTGLGNRRRLDADLAAACERPGSGWLLALFDLDGFKTYNDAYGHPAGDALLTRLGGALAGRAGRQAYRLGGDEFCVLAPGPPDVGSYLAACAGALSESGAGYAIRPSLGAALVGAEASTPGEALRLADRRLYRDKCSRQTAAAPARSLLGALEGHAAGLSEHTAAVARLARAVGEELALDPARLRRLEEAALLHDVGKIAVPAAILSKPAPLEEHEWSVVKQHPLAGERLLGCLPAFADLGSIVRSTHERWDGGGYPDGLAGEAIPLEARIIAACDAFDAILGERPYRQARSPAWARAELARCAGSQFDPRVVAALLRRAAGWSPAERAATPGAGGHVTAASSG